MGISMIMVMIFHTANPSVHLFGIEMCPLKRGDLGVDFFLVLSAIGCYFSLSKNVELLSFYKKRIIRIIPTFVVCAFLYSVVLYYTKGRPLSSFWEYVTMYALLKGDIAFWYIGNIMVCYLAMPFLYKLSGNKKMYLLFAALFTLLMFGPIYHYVGYGVSICRFPIFVISVPIAKTIYENKNKSDYVITKQTFAMLTMIAIICYILTTIVFSGEFGKYLSYLIVCIPILLWLAICVSMTPVSIRMILAFVGGISLEIYLLHSLIIAPVLHIFIQNIPVLFICSAIVTIALGHLLHKIMNHVTNVLPY